MEEHGNSPGDSADISIDDLLESMKSPETLPIGAFAVSCPTRVGPLVRIHPYRLTAENLWVDALHVPGSRKQESPKHGTVAAIVQKANDNNQIFYILTVGHTSYKVDSNHDNSSQVTFSWGERNLDDKAPHSTSNEQYYYPADTRSSEFDAELIRLHENVPWSNIYRFTTSTGTFSKKLLALDDEWSQCIKEGYIYRIRELEITNSNFQVRDTFACDLVEENGKNPCCTLQRVLLLPRTKGKQKGDPYTKNGTTLYGGSSGSALIRYKAESEDAVVVAMILGYGSEVVEVDGTYKTVGVVYDIFQHISVVKASLGLLENLPQPIEN